MKRVEHSDYILIKAVSAGEPDDCDFAIIHITEQWKGLQQRRLEIVSLLSGEPNFFYLSYWSSPEGFYKNGEDEAQWSSSLLQGDSWCFIEYSQNKSENLETPENVEALCQIHIYADGRTNYIAYSKNETGEFITDDFKIADLLKTITV